jgi:hypothetical protein
MQHIEHNQDAIIDQGHLIKVDYTLVENNQNIDSLILAY